jgi:hypothetical protein
MSLVFTRLRAVLVFYRSVAPFMLGCSALLIGAVQVPSLLEGITTGVPPLLVLVKVLVDGAVWYLAEQMRPNQYWLYYNLGMSRPFLWLSVGVLDGGLFLLAALAVAAWL